MLYLLALRFPLEFESITRSLSHLFYLSLSFGFKVSFEFDTIVNATGAVFLFQLLQSIEIQINKIIFGISHPKQKGDGFIWRVRRISSAL